MKKKDTDIRNFDISEHWVTNDEMTLMEYALAGCIEEWQKSKKEPRKSLKQLREDALGLEIVAQESIPCWKKFRSGGPFTFKNGLMETPAGTALIHNGYFVMLEDLDERLPRIVDHI